MAKVSTYSMDRSTLESASAADRPFQIVELPAQPPVLPDLPAPFLARCSRREARHSAFHSHVPLHLVAASSWTFSRPFCNRFHCRTVILNKNYQHKHTPHIGSPAWEESMYIYLIHSSSTAFLLFGNALRKSPFWDPRKPCYKTSVSLHLIIYLSNQTYKVDCGACIIISTVLRHGIILPTKRVRLAVEHASSYPRLSTWDNLWGVVRGIRLTDSAFDWTELNLMQR